MNFGQGSEFWAKEPNLFQGGNFVPGGNSVWGGAHPVLSPLSPGRRAAGCAAPCGISCSRRRCRRRSRCTRSGSAWDMWTSSSPSSPPSTGRCRPWSLPGALHNTPKFSFSGSLFFQGLWGMEPLWGGSGDEFGITMGIPQTRD